MTGKKQMLIMRIFIVFFVAISASIAVFQYKSDSTSIVNSIAQLMGVSWGALAGAFLAPFLLSLYSKRITKVSVIVNFFFGVAVMIANMLFRTYFPEWLQSPINCGALTMLFGFIIVPLVSLFTKKPDKDTISETFSCYSKKLED